jgi:hypothetical protein
MDGSFPLARAGGLTMAPRRYSFDGEMVTAAELSKRVTCYSEAWLGEALRAGCRSIRDLAVRYYESGLRRKQGERRGHKKLRRFFKD